MPPTTTIEIQNKIVSLLPFFSSPLSSLLSATLMGKEEQKPHAIFVTYPLQGHVIPSVNLAIKLASKGFTITFINTDAIHHKTSKARLDSGGGGGSGGGHDDDIFAGARKAGLDIRYRTVTDGLPVEFDRSVNHDQFMASLLHVFSAHVEVLVRKIIKCEPPVTCLIADTFFVWPSMIAKKFGLLYVSFWTEPALIFTLYYHIHLLRANSHFACQDKREDTIDYIPGVSSIEPTDLTSYLQDTDTTTVCHQIIYKCFEDARGADFVLCNTVQELEPNTISALQVEMPFYAVGPIFPTKSLVATSLWSESDCTQWLNTKPHGSVLYVSFGSYANLSRHEIMEIAKGLHLSKVNILWVVRPDIVVPEEGDPLPDGYREDMGERGLIVQWCRQLEVLKHPAVGGFLTHCGWNSILETIWCGVPMLCYPLYTDQFTNRKLVAGDWMVGLDLCQSRNRVTKDEVAKKINLLMSGKDGEKCREEIKSVRKAFENATAADGSSSRNLDQFIVDLRDRTAAAPHRSMEVRI
ncbi:UDP-glycosyltransferase 86A1-like [Macadamia integrifolia]|uniref:UDP-glycosyltransferase 86A1-like n=1 Tax=Macadamia integrifolia TaxID=60698 RepID=UPI001C502630|nr:UDP-glycosyltransferase 86A1-like [Macadamia integrifolia]